MSELDANGVVYSDEEDADEDDERSEDDDGVDRVEEGLPISSSDEHSIGDKYLLSRVSSSSDLINSYMTVSAAARSLRRQAANASPTLHDDARKLRVAELVSTEVTYVKDLEVLQQYFADATADRPDIVPTHKRTALFGHSLAVLPVNRELCAELQQEAKHPCDKQCIGSLLLAKAPYLTIYMTVCTATTGALAAYSELMQTNAAFYTFMKECRLMEATHGLDLQSFLVKPLQRVCKYPLLVKAILKHTSPDHVDYDGLSKAYDALSDVVLQIEQQKGAYEEMMAVSAVQRLVRWGRSELELVHPQRRLMKEGLLRMERVGRRRHSLTKALRGVIARSAPAVTLEEPVVQMRWPTTMAKPPDTMRWRYVYLFNDALLICSQKKRFREFSVIRPSEWQVDRGKRWFSIEIVGGSRRHIFWCPDADQLDDWITASGLSLAFRSPPTPLASSVAGTASSVSLSPSLSLNSSPVTSPDVERRRRSLSLVGGQGMSKGRGMVVKTTAKLRNRGRSRSTEITTCLNPLLQRHAKAMEKAQSVSRQPSQGDNSRKGRRILRVLSPRRRMSTPSSSPMSSPITPPDSLPKKSTSSLRLRRRGHPKRTHSLASTIGDSSDRKTGARSPPSSLSLPQPISPSAKRIDSTETMPISQTKFVPSQSTAAMPAVRQPRNLRRLKKRVTLPRTSASAGSLLESLSKEDIVAYKERMRTEYEQREEERLRRLTRRSGPSKSSVMDISDLYRRRASLGAFVGSEGHRFRSSSSHSSDFSSAGDSPQPNAKEAPLNALDDGAAMASLITSMDSMDGMGLGTGVASPTTGRRSSGGGSRRGSVHGSPRESVRKHSSPKLSVLRPKKPAVMGVVSPNQVRVRLPDNGSLVLKSKWLAKAGLHPSTPVCIRIEEGRLVVERKVDQGVDDNDDDDESSSVDIILSEDSSDSSTAATPL